jgi:hypothetical protein
MSLCACLATRSQAIACLLNASRLSSKNLLSVFLHSSSRAHAHVRFFAAFRTHGSTLRLCQRLLGIHSSVNART